MFSPKQRKERHRDKTRGDYPPSEGYLDPRKRYKLTRVTDGLFKDEVVAGTTFTIHRTKHSHVSGCPMYRILPHVPGDNRILHQRMHWKWVRDGDIEVEPLTEEVSLDPYRTPVVPIFAGSGRGEAVATAIKREYGEDVIITVPEDALTIDSHFRAGFHEVLPGTEIPEP